MTNAEAANVQTWLAGDSCSGHKKSGQEEGEGTGEGQGTGWAIKGQLLGTFERRLDGTQVFQCHLAIFKRIRGVAGTGQTYVQYRPP